MLEGEWKFLCVHGTQFLCFENAVPCLLAWALGLGDQVAGSPPPPRCPPHPPSGCWLTSCVPVGGRPVRPLSQRLSRLTARLSCVRGSEAFADRAANGSTPPTAWTPTGLRALSVLRGRRPGKWDLGARGLRVHPQVCTLCIHGDFLRESPPSSFLFLPSNAFRWLKRSLELVTR